MKTHKLLVFGVITVMAVMLTASCEKSKNSKNEKFLFEEISSVNIKSSFATEIPSESYCGPMKEFSLIGGQTIFMGTVQIVNDDDYLYVKYAAADGYIITETHLYLGAIGDMPMNTSGNPKIGHFPYKFESENGEGQVEVIHMIPLNEIGGCFDIAAHAVVECEDGSCETDEETAWGKSEDLVFSLKARLSDSEDDQTETTVTVSTQEIEIAPSCRFQLGYNDLKLDELPIDDNLSSTIWGIDDVHGKVTIQKVDETLVFTVYGLSPYDYVNLSSLFVGSPHSLIQDMRTDGCLDWLGWSNFNSSKSESHVYIVDIPGVGKDLESKRWGFYIENFCLNRCD